MKHSTRNILKACAVILTVLLVYPSLLLSASAIDAATEEESQVITASLQSIMEENTEETTRVAIWLKDYDTPEALATESMPDYQTRIDTLVELEESSDAPNETIHSMRMKRSALRFCYEPYTRYFATKFLPEETVVFCDTYLPFIIADLTREKIVELANLNIIKSIEYYNDDIESNDMSSENSSTYASSLYHYGIESHIQYINAGTLRSSMTANDVINIGILDQDNPILSNVAVSSADAYVHYPNANTDAHATYVLEILYKLVPYAKFYCTTHINANTETTLAQEIQWLLDNDVSVINASIKVPVLNNGSWTLDAENIYGSISQYLDQIVYTYDVVFVKSAGNVDEEQELYGITSGGMAYNIITVGNFNRYLNTMSNYSCYAPGTTGAYKPDISAPGYFIFEDGTYSEGTSFSAPMVAGVAALLLATNSYLADQPSLVKAILCAATKSAHQYTPDDEEYQSFGAGVIDAENARILASSVTIMSFSAPNTVGNYTDFNITLNAGSTARIAMVFEKKNLTSSTYSLGNADLYVYNTTTGTQLDSSVTTNNNVEIVEFTPPTTGTYTVRVKTISRPTNGTTATNLFCWFAWCQGGN